MLARAIKSESNWDANLKVCEENEENERGEFCGIFYGGDSRAATRAIGSRGIDAQGARVAIANTASPACVFAQETHPRSHVERAVAPAQPPWAVRGCCGDLDAAVAHCAKRTTSCSIFVIKSLSD